MDLTCVNICVTAGHSIFLQFHQLKYFVSESDTDTIPPHFRVISFCFHTFFLPLHRMLVLHSCDPVYLQVKCNISNLTVSIYFLKGKNKTSEEKIEKSFA